MTVKSEFFRNTNYAALVGLIADTMEVLIQQHCQIDAVTITASTHPSDEYLGTIFFRDFK